MIDSRRWLAVALCALLAFGAGCSSGSSSDDPSAAPTPTPAPRVTAAPGKVAAPEVQRFAGYTVNVKPVKGPQAVLAEPIAAQLLLDASVTTRLQVTDATATFKNDLVVQSPDGASRYHFKLSSDGQMLLKDDLGHMFRMPEYLYYMLEQRLWENGGSLKEGALSWQPESGNTQQLETELPRLIKAAMLPAYGYALAYFCSYKIYGVNTATKDTAKVYLLLMYKGYDVGNSKGSAFLPLFSHTGAAMMQFTRVRGNTWQLTDMRLPAAPKDSSSQAVYNSVRKVLLYDYMDAYETDIKDTSALSKDIVRQATDYLRENSLTGLTIGD